MSESNGLNSKLAYELVLELLKIPGPPGKESKVAQAIVNRLRKAGVVVAHAHVSGPEAVFLGLVHGGVLVIQRVEKASCVLHRALGWLSIGKPGEI